MVRYFLAYFYFLFFKKCFKTMKSFPNLGVQKSTSKKDHKKGRETNFAAAKKFFATTKKIWGFATKIITEYPKAFLASLKMQE